MSIVKSFSVGNGDMFYINHNTDNFTTIDCCYDRALNRLRIFNEIAEVSKGKGITRFISTHPDEDHIRGLKEYNSKFGIVNFYCVDNEATKDEEADILIISAKIESDIAELESYEERQMFLEEMGLEESGVIRLIQHAYSLLNLRTYFTVGVEECRAWTINKGDKAPRAASVIHTDFEKGFIRAEVIKYEDFITLKSEAACRAAGKLGIEGKEYVVQDGDIMHFLFNV